MLYIVFKTNLVISILFTLATNLSYTVFLTILFFTKSLSLLESTGIGTNLSISNLSISAFKLAKSDFSASLDVSIPVAFLKSHYFAKLNKSTLALISLPNGLYGLRKY